MRKKVMTVEEFAEAERAGTPLDDEDIVSWSIRGHGYACLVKQYRAVLAAAEAGQLSQTEEELIVGCHILKRMSGPDAG